MEVAYNIILLTATLASLIQYKKLDKASQYIVIFLAFTLCSELIASWAAHQFRQNNPVYNIANLIDYTLICLYFNNTIPSFKRKRIGLTFIITGAILYILNLAFLQSIYILNTNFLAFESTTIVGMCLYYFYDFLKSDTYLKRLPLQFWTTSLLLVFWSFTLFHWLVGFYLMYSKGDISDLPYYITMLVSTLTYLSFGILFFNYRKMSQVD